jgi:hypothetical protein
MGHRRREINRGDAEAQRSKPEPKAELAWQPSHNAFKLLHRFKLSKTGEE